MITTTEKETLALGFAIGQLCRGGEVFALSGDLGAGKTKLIQGLAAGLGIRTRVNSPTFNILKVYRIKVRSKQKKEANKFCHVDAYRLKTATDLEALGIAEIFQEARTVTTIEWGERVKKIWPPRTKVIKIRCLGEAKRAIVIK